MFPAILEDSHAASGRIGIDQPLGDARGDRLPHPGDRLGTGLVDDAAPTGAMTQPGLRFSPADPQEAQAR